MTDKAPLMALGVFTALDLFVLDPNPPPFSFKRDLNLPPHPVAPPPLPTAAPYKSPKIDTGTFWQKTSYTHD